MTRGILGAFWLSATLLLGACGGGGGSGGGGVTMVAVPNVTGLAQASATSAITAAGLMDSVTMQSSGTVASGAVISQSPAAGTRVATGSSVALVVSSGATPVMVPNVVGMTQSAATAAITGAGLTLGTVTMAPSATVAAGGVISQNPTAGSSVAPGSAVSLVVSAGPPVLVPNVVGQTQAIATTTITGAGLQLGTVTTQSSATVAAGLVISQNPAANTGVAAGAVVSLVVSSGPAPANTLAITVDAGPSSLVSAGQLAANEAFATVTICTPGSATACQVIDHLLVDTGSVGLQIVAEVLTGSASPTPIQDPNTNGPLRECVQFADGYSWGSMVVADVTIGQRKVSNLPMHMIGDSAAGTAPSSCSTGAGPAENTVALFGSNGVLGVGYWLQDCGTFCASSAPSGIYYGCPNGTCQPTPVDVGLQAQNPVGMFSTDNNGILIDLPAVAAPGAATVQGTLYFGISTQANNAIGSATTYTVDGSGDLLTSFGSPPVSYNQSFIDSGSNAYFFTSSLLPACTVNTGFYCPTTSTPETATITGRNNKNIVINFTVDDADTVVTQNLTAFPNLAGSPSLGAGTNTNSFDWGLPFFFGRKVYVLFENGNIAGTQGPASAF